MKQLYYTSICLLIVTYNFGQTPRKSAGLLLNDSIYNSLPRLMNLNGAKFDELPIQMSLKEFCPKSEDQGDIGSCVGWAVGYGALTVLRAIQEKMDNRSEITKVANSASFIFNQVKEGKNCEEGAFLNEALQFLKENGDCLTNSFLNSTTDCTQLPTEQEKQEARFYKIKDFAKVFGTDEPAFVKISQVKKLLSDSIPLIVGLQLDEQFWSLDSTTKTWIPLTSPQYSFVHAMVVTGYNDRTETFELLNSYGEFWGNRGFFEISYTDFARYCKQAYTMLLNQQNLKKGTEEEEFVLEGEFLFRQLVGKTMNSVGVSRPVFEEQKMQFFKKKGVYCLNKKAAIGDVFQLIIKNIPQGQHVYILSLDAKNKAQVHWPKENLATFVPSKNASIILPNKSRGLRLSHKGTDYLIVLYANKKLEKINTQTQELKMSSGNIKEKLNKVFGHLLIPDEQIQYYPYKMQFQSHSKKGNGVVVALVLAITVK